MKKTKEKRCKKCGAWDDFKGDICNVCVKYGDRVIISEHLLGRHIKRKKDCKECDSWFFINPKGDVNDWSNKSIDVYFPIIHKNCGGLIHLDNIGYNDGYSVDINLVFECDECGEFLHTRSEGEYIDDEFKETFGFVPKTP